MLLGMTLQLQDLIQAVPFAARLGIALEEASPDRVVAVLEWAPDLCTVGSALHGGVLMSLADTAGAVCAYLSVPPGGATATSTSSTVLCRPATRGRLTATATPVHRGRTRIVVRTEVTDESGRLISTTTQEQAVLLPAG